MAAGATYEPITTSTFSAQTTVNLTSFSGYTDLVLIYVGSQSVSNAAWIRLNSDSGTNYAVTRMTGSGASASSSRTSTGTEFGFGAAANSPLPSMAKIHLMSYSGSSRKGVLAEIAADSNGSGSVSRFVGNWNNTSAITTITLGSYSGTITGTVSLYGIKVA